jgi:probable F420-dependent oxidoreductase
VVLDTDADRARSVGRPVVARPYLGLVNYRSNLQRLGWSESDLDDGGSDALIDALVAHGEVESVAARLTAHLDAGADHVCAQVLTADDADPLPALRELATALKLG